jgi:hypothetical protein
LQPSMIVYMKISCDILSLTCELADRGRKLKPLGKVETEDGEITNVVTDMPFMDMIISPTGSVLPLTTPPGFFEKHEAEREAVREKERQRQEAIERDRALPLRDKAALVMELARYGK